MWRMFRVSSTAVAVDALMTPSVSVGGLAGRGRPVGLYNVTFGVKQSGKADLLFKGDFRFWSWEDTFAYQVGEFRFVGNGAWPFWVFNDEPAETAGGQ